MSDRPATDDRGGRLFVLTPVALGISGVSALRSAFNLVVRKYRLIGIITAVCLLAGVAYAFLATPIYRAQVTLGPTNNNGMDSSGLGGVLGQFGSLAALAGLSGLYGSNTQEAVAVLESRAFTASFIEDKNLLPILFNDEWDEKTKSWNDPDDAPTVADGVKMFEKQIRDVSVDPGTGLVTMTIDWKDADQAAAWANELTARLNANLREREMAEASKSITFLDREVQRSDVVEVRNMLYDLMEEQTKRRMLAAVNEQFAFRVLDPAVPSQPDDRLRPRRLVVILVAALLGLIFGVIAAIVVDRPHRFDPAAEPRATD